MSTSEEQLTEQNQYEISSDEMDYFKPIGTIKVALFQLVFACSLEILVIVLFLTKESSQNGCGQINVILFSQTALWFSSCILDSYFRNCHNLIRLRGHFSYQKKLNNHSTMFLNLISLGNTVIICTIGILFQMNAGEICHNGGGYFTPTFIIFYIFTFQILMLIPNYVNYILNTHYFNKTRQLSDVEKYECYSFVDELTRAEVGFRFECDAVQKYLEKQVDLVHYYIQANHCLIKKLNDVQHSFSASCSNDASADGTCEIHMS